MITTLVGSQLLRPKVIIPIIVALTIASVGYFFWRYVEKINTEKLNLAIEVQDERQAKEIVNEQLGYKAAESQQRENATQAYLDILDDTTSELERVKAEHSKLEGKFNAIQFSKHFDDWATVNPNRLSDCMQSSFNQLLDNLEAATRNQIPAYPDPMSCSPNG